jgi:hypothetical protein
MLKIYQNFKCNKEFSTDKLKRRFCSRRCSGVYSAEKKKESGKKYYHSIETKRKISKGNRGKRKPSPFKGMTAAKRYGSEERAQEIQNRRRLKLIGKKHTEEHKQKIGNAGRGRKKTVATRLRMSESRKGMKQPEYVKKKISKTVRLNKIQQLEKNSQISKPSYNIRSCEFFKYLDILYKTEGRYAIYGGGEYFIKELGYFPDYINFDKKWIIEWDEPMHFTKEGNLREKDKVRQQEIQKMFPDYKFIRIRATLNLYRLLQRNMKKLKLVKLSKTGFN